MSEHERISFEGNVRKSFVYTLLMEFGLWFPIWVLYLRDQRNFSLAQITLLDVPFFLLIVFAEVPTGAVADRFGRKVSLALAAGFYAIAIYVFAVATNYTIIFVSYAAWGFSVTFRSGADTALLYDSLKEAGREGDFHRVNSRLGAVRSAAVLAGVLLGAPIAAATSFTFVIKLSAINGTLALVVALFMHEPRHTREQSVESYIQTLVRGVTDSWRNAPLRYIFLYGGVLSASTFGPMIVYQQPWLAAHGVKTASLGLWQAPTRGAAILGALWAGWFLTRLGEKGTFFALPVVLVACNLALAGIDHAAVATAFIGIGFVSGLQVPMLASYVNRHIESKRRATALSAQSVVSSIALAIFNPIGGLVADKWGLRAVFLMFAFATTVFVGGALLLWTRAESQVAPMRPNTSSS